MPMLLGSDSICDSCGGLLIIGVIIYVIAHVLISFSNKTVHVVRHQAGEDCGCLIFVAAMIGASAFVLARWILS